MSETEAKKQLKKCKRCNDEFEPYTYSEPCMVCDVDGLQDGHFCQYCKGDREVDTYEDEYCMRCMEEMDLNDELR